MASKSHGRVGVFKIDNLASALVDVSTYLNQAQDNFTSDRPATETFGQDAGRHEVLGLRDASYSLQGFCCPSSAKIHGRAMVILHGAYDISEHFDTATINLNVDIPETQTFGNGWKRREVTGLKRDTLSLGGFHDRTASSGSLAILRAALASEAVVVQSLFPNGYAVGELVELVPAVCSSRSIPANVNDPNKATGEFNADGGIYLGVSLHAVGARTVAGTYDTVDETAATANGGFGHLHVTAVGGAGSAVFNIQHSTDGIAWSDLATFTAVTAVGGYRVEIAKGTTVNQYVRAELDSIGTFTSITFQISFARRDFAYGNTGSYRHWRGLVQRAATSTVEHGPDGNTAGYPKITGEFRLSSLTLTVNENDVTKFSANLVSDSTIDDTATW